MDSLFQIRKKKASLTHVMTSFLCNRFPYWVRSIQNAVRVFYIAADSFVDTEKLYLLLLPGNMHAMLKQLALN